MKTVNLKTIGLIFSIMIMGWVLNGCSRDGSGDAPSEVNYYRFKFNGELRDYSQHIDSRIDVRFLKSRNKHIVFLLYGYDKNKNANMAGPALVIDLYSEIKNDAGEWTGIDISTGTYKAAYNEDHYLLRCNYYVTGTDNISVLDDKFVLTITELSKTRAKGVFSGTLYNSSTGEHVAITDGEFSLPVRYREVN